MKKFILFGAFVLFTKAHLFAQAFVQEFDDSSAVKTQGWKWKSNSKVLDPTARAWYLSSGGTSAVTSQSGSDCFQSSFETCLSTSSTDTISNWLMSPVVNLYNGSSIVFYTTKEGGNTAYPDNMQVRLSTSGTAQVTGSQANSTAPFNTVLLDINPSLTTSNYPLGWTQYSLTLSGITGTVQGRFAFWHIVPDVNTNGTYIDIDSVAYISGGGVLTVKQESKPIEFSVFPNPASDKVKIKFSNGSITKNRIEVYDLSGRKVMELISEAEVTEIDVKELANGSYLMKVSSGSLITTKPLVILKN